MRRRNRRGFVLIATAVSVVVLLACLGLVVDLGRAYIAQNEAKAFTDSAALLAATRLNNMSSGIVAAQTAVANSTNRWYFSTKSFTNVVTEFSQDKVSWTAAPATGIGYKFVRVSAPQNPVSVLFSTVLSSQSVMNVGATSIAGYQIPNTFRQGVFPFAPLAHDPSPPHFGYSFGDELTLLWPSSVQGGGAQQQMNNLCQSDRNQAALDAVREGTTSDRGYIQETSASSIAAAIEDDHMDYTVSLGMPVQRTGGVKTTDVYQSLDARVNQDSTSSEPNYSTYITNHDSAPTRRVVIVPIVDNAVNAIVLGFAKVFLPPNQPHNPNRAKCAMYIGPADTPSGNGADGSNILRLVE